MSGSYNLILKKSWSMKPNATKEVAVRGKNMVINSFTYGECNLLVASLKGEKITTDAERKSNRRAIIFKNLLYSGPLKWFRPPKSLACINVPKNDPRGNPILPNVGSCI